jgi:hypothetical protein
MNALLLVLALLVPPAPGEGWWNKEWKYRRPVAVRNRLDRPLEKGFTVQVEIDPDYLDLRDRSRPDFGDWVLVRRGVRLPCLLQPGRGKTLLLNFRIAEEIPVGAVDTSLLYYGNPDAAPAPATPGDVFEFHEDFSRPESLSARFAVDKDLTVAVRDGALAVLEAPGGRPASAPSRIVFRNFPALADFDLSFDLEMDGTDAAAASCLVTIDLREPGAGDASTLRKIAALAERLGDDSWEAREKATRELIAVGRAAVATLTELTQSPDAEVRWRSSHILLQIAERCPAPRIAAGVDSWDPKQAVTLQSVIGKNRSFTRSIAGRAGKTRISIQRDADGDVKVTWDGRSPQSGSMPGEIREVGFSILKGTASPLGTIRIRNIVVRRSVDDDARPACTIEVEESRP